MHTYSTHVGTLTVMHTYSTHVGTLTMMHADSGYSIMAIALHFTWCRGGWGSEQKVEEERGSA